MNKLFIIFLLFISLSSCRKEIDLKLKDADVRLVVEGQLTNEKKVHIIKLSKTSNFFSTQAAERVTGAIVKINDGETSILLKEVASGIYQTDSTYQGVIGRTYTLTIDYDSEKYSATSLLKPIFTMDSINIIKLDSNPNPRARRRQETHEIIMYAQEQTTHDNYYLWKAYVNGINVTDTISKIQYSDNSVLEYNFNGYYIEMPIYEEIDTKVGDTIKLEINSISKEYFDFLYKIPDGINIGNPFTGPLTNTKGNIKNLTNPEKDVMGFFSTSAVSSCSKKVEE